MKGKLLLPSLLVVGLFFLTPALAQAQEWQDTTDTLEDTTAVEDTTETLWQDTTGTAQLPLLQESEHELVNTSQTRPAFSAVNSKSVAVSAVADRPTSPMVRSEAANVALPSAPW